MSNQSNQIPNPQTAGYQSVNQQPMNGYPTQAIPPQPNYAGQAHQAPNATKKNKYILIGGIAAVCVAIIAIAGVIIAKSIGGDSGNAQVGGGDIPQVATAQTLTCSRTYTQSAFAEDFSTGYIIDNTESYICRINT